MPHGISRVCRIEALPDRRDRQACSTYVPLEDGGACSARALLTMPGSERAVLTPLARDPVTFRASSVLLGLRLPAGDFERSKRTMSVYTMGIWQAKPGREDEFAAAWWEFAERTGRQFLGVKKTNGTLLRDRDQPGRS